MLSLFQPPASHSPTRVQSHVAATEVNLPILPDAALTQQKVMLQHFAINYQLLPAMSSTEKKIMLIAPCTLSAIEMAGEFVLKGRNNLIPKMIIIDDSVYAFDFWQKFNSFILNLRASDNLEIQINFFLSDIKQVFIPDNCASSQAEEYLSYQKNYLLNLLQKFNYKLLAKILENALYVKQRWTDTNTFLELRSIIQREAELKVYVYAATLIAFSRTDEAQKMLVNIFQLTPSMVLHCNYAVYRHEVNQLLYFYASENNPENVIEHITAAISYALPDNGIKPFDVQRSYDELQDKLLVLTANYNSAFSHYSTPFLLDIILKMAAINFPLTTYAQEESRYLDNIVFHLPEDCRSHIPSWLAVLKQKMPHFNHGFTFLDECVAHDDYPISISMNLGYIKQNILPAIPEFLATHPTVLQSYINAPSIDKSIKLLFAKHNLDTTKVNCFEDTLCLLVQSWLLNKRRILDINLSSTESIFAPDTADNNRTIIYLTIPLESAVHIAAFLNELQTESAFVFDEQASFAGGDTMFTRISIANLVMLQPVFLEHIENFIPEYVKKDHAKAKGRSQRILAPSPRKLINFDKLLADDEFLNFRL